MSDAENYVIIICSVLFILVLVRTILTKEMKEDVKQFKPSIYDPESDGQK